MSSENDRIACGSSSQCESQVSELNLDVKAYYRSDSPTERSKNTILMNNSDQSKETNGLHSPSRSKRRASGKLSGSGPGANSPATKMVAPSPPIQSMPEGCILTASVCTPESRPSTNVIQIADRSRYNNSTDTPDTLPVVERSHSHTRFTPPNHIRLPPHVRMSNGAPPHSPTDHVMSPVSSMINRRKSSLKARAKQRSRHSTLVPSHCPPSSSHKLILGSSSTWRKEVMMKLGYTFDPMSADIDETQFDAKTVPELVLKIAHAKADTLMKKIKEPSLLITSDQLVVLQGNYDSIPPRPAQRNSNSDSGACAEAWAKPLDRNQAKQYIAAYSNSFVQTITAVIVTDTMTHSRWEAVDIGTVHFDEIPEMVIDQVLDDNSEPSNSLDIQHVSEDGSAKQPKDDSDGVDWRNALLHCCGAVCIDHPKLKDFVRQIDGQVDSVLGLPSKELEQLLQTYGKAPAPVPPTLSADATVALNFAARDVHGQEPE